MMAARFDGLMAAAHTPFAADGSLALDVVERQASALLADGVQSVFIGGSTGESHSLTLDERQRLAVRWFEVARGTPLRVVVHAGSNCLADARTLAVQAERLGAAAISALAPSYFKPGSVEALVACCADLAAAAPATPFYFYDIPALTGVHLPMADFLEQAGGRIPTLAGLKFTNVDFVAYQLCAAVAGGRFELLWGVDEMLLPALAVGARGGIGSTYNFAAPLYRQIIDAFDRGDLEAARGGQMRSIGLIRILARRGYMASAKALMGWRGVAVGAPRLPHLPLSAESLTALRNELVEGGFLAS